MASISVRLVDYSGEKTVASFPIGDQNDTVQWSVVSGLADSLQTAVDALTLGTIESVTISQLNYDNAPADRPTDPFAQREIGLRFRYHNTSGRGFITLGTADLDVINITPGTDLADLADTQVAALVSWIEANVLLGGAAVTVDYAQVVGRNS